MLKEKHFYFSLILLVGGIVSWVVRRIREKLLTRPVEREIDPEDILDHIVDMNSRDIARVLRKIGYKNLESFLEDNPFVYDVISKYEEEYIREFCEEQGIEDEEECFSDDNLYEYIRETYPTVEDLINTSDEIWEKVVDGYREYLAGELIVEKLYELIDKGKFNPQDKRDIQALKRVIQRFPFNRSEKEELESYVFSEL